MHFAFIILCLSMIAWILPPFRQKGTRYFFYFLSLAIADPLGYLLYKTIALYPMKFYLFSSYISFLLLYDKEIIRKYLPLNAAAIISTIFVTWFSTVKTIGHILPIIEFALLLVFLKNFIVQSYQKKEITLFYFILIMYQLSIVVKLVLILIEVKTGYMYFAITSMFEILIGIFFAFFNEDKPGWALSLAENMEAAE